MKFPLGIVIVNVSGSFLLGLVIESGSDIAYGLMGFCGALTTWSAFALDLFEEVDKKDFRSFTLNLLTNYGLGVLAAALGIWVAS
jgi:CrcB protein